MARSSFEIKELALPGVLLIEPKLWHDERGFFAETYYLDAFAAAGITHPFVQDNVSFSKKNVLRGMHAQKQPHPQAKLVRCVQGEIFDVAADHNPHSSTFGKHVSTTLSGEKQNMLYIPARYLHGFYVLSEEALVEYKASDYYHPECAFAVRYDDPTLAIPWPAQNPILSEQDNSLQSIK